MLKNTASQKLTVFAFDYSTNAPKTGDAANLTAYVSIDDGALTALTDSSAAELDATNGKGIYTFDLTQAETNGTKLVFTAKSSTANVSIVPQIIYAQPANFPLLSIDSTGRLDIGKWLGTAVTLTSSLPDVNTKTIANGIIAAATFAANALDAVWSTTARALTDKAGFSLSSAGVQAIWDALTSALTTANSVGKLLADNVNATISSRSSHAAADVWSVGTRTLTSFGTLVADMWAYGTRVLTGYGTLTAPLDAAGTRSAMGLASANLDTQLGAHATALATVDSNVDDLKSGIIYGAAATGTISTTQATTNLTGYADDQFIGRYIVWLTGSCEGEATDITDYASASGLLTFSALTTAPGNGDTFKIV